MWQSYPVPHATLLLSLSLISSLLLSLSRPRSITASGCNNYKIFNRIIKAAGTRAKGQSRRRYLPTYLAPGNGPCDNVNQRQTQTTTATTREWDRERERGGKREGERRSERRIERTFQGPLANNLLLATQMVALCLLDFVYPVGKGKRVQLEAGRWSVAGFALVLLKIYFYHI